MSSNQVKSLIAGGFLIFLMLVVFRGEIIRRSYYGVSYRYGVSYCHNVEGVPVLGDMPCYLFNWLVTLLIVVIFFTTVLLVIAIARKLSR